MGQYKVPQNVEAEDKLLGPLSFRQFIYALIAIGSGALAFFLATNISPPLAIIPVPVFLVFSVLALPLRKDQPMETYIAAMIRFWFVPHTRIWDSDSEDALVEIASPVVDDKPATKDLDAEETRRRLSFLTRVVDSEGWSILGLDGMPNNNLADEFAAEANNAPDILDNNDITNKRIDNKLHQSEQQTKYEVISSLQAQAVSTPQAPMDINSSYSALQPSSRAVELESAPEPIFVPPDIKENETISVKDHSLQVESLEPVFAAAESIAPIDQTQHSTLQAAETPQQAQSEEISPVSPESTSIDLEDSVTSQSGALDNLEPSSPNPSPAKPKTGNGATAMKTEHAYDTSVDTTSGQKDEHTPRIEESEIVLH